MEGFPLPLVSYYSIGMPGTQQKKNEAPFRKLRFYVSFIYFAYLFLINSSIPFAPAFPAPIARITVAAPVTASPPA